MFVQRHNDFLDARIIEIDEHADRKQDAAIRDNAIWISDIDAASSRVVMDAPGLAGWFCLTVKDKSEFSVRDVLKQQKIWACVPSRLGDEIKKRHRVLPPASLPVIPGYLLVHCVPSIAAFRGLKSIKRVTGILGNGGYPYRVPTKYIEHFIALADAGEFDYRREDHGYEVGMEVIVTGGPFASFAAIVTDISKTTDEGRINVEVNIFGRSTPIELDLKQIGRSCAKPKSMRVNRSRIVR